MMSLLIDRYMATGEDTRSGSDVLTGKYAWYGVYNTADGEAISVGAIEPHFFRNLCRLLEFEQYSDQQYNDDLQDEMKADFKARFLTQTRDYWTEKLSGNNTCVAPVLHIPEIVKNEHLLSRSSFIHANHPVEGDFRQLGPILAGGIREQPVHQVSKPGSTDTDSVLLDVGYTVAEIEHLKGSGYVE